MSSPTRPQPYQAQIHRCGVSHGPVRLPLDDREAFVAEFNRRYTSLGLQLTCRPAAELIVPQQCPHNRTQ